MMNKKFSDEEKYSLVERYYGGEPVSDICLSANIVRSTFYSWLEPYKVDYTKKGKHGVSAAEFVKIKKQNEKLSQIIEILKKVNCTVSSPPKEKLSELALLYGQYNIHVLCEALEVPRGTFYNHVLRNKVDNKSYQFRRNELSEKIKEVYEKSNQIYGAKKIRAVLVEQGIIVSDKMVSELLHEMNLTSIRLGAKKNYFQICQEKRKDELKMNFTVAAPNLAWVSDVTYFKIKGQFMYVCVILDLYSRKAIAYKISEKHSTQLITRTFKAAYSNRKPNENLIFHSDRGSQYTAYAFQELLKKCNVKQSFSPAGKPRYNAVVESFFSNLKREELYRTNYRSIDEFKENVKTYINSYNTERPHTSLQYKTPDAYEDFYYKKINPEKE